MVHDDDMQMSSSIPNGLMRLSSNIGALGLGLAFAQSGQNLAFQLIFGLTPVITLNIAWWRTRSQTLATVHSLSEWRSDSHSDTTPATGAAVHQLAL